MAKFLPQIGVFGISISKLPDHVKRHAFGGQVKFNEELQTSK